MMPPGYGRKSHFSGQAHRLPGRSDWQAERLPLQRVLSRLPCLSGAFAQKLGDIKVHEIGVMKNNRFDRTLDLVSLVTVSGDHVHDFCRNAVLVGEGDAAEWMSKLLAELSLNHFSGCVFVILERLAHIGEERA